MKWLTVEVHLDAGDDWLCQVAVTSLAAEPRVQVSAFQAADNQYVLDHVLRGSLVSLVHQTVLDPPGHMWPRATCQFHLLCKLALINQRHRLLRVSFGHSSLNLI